MRNKIDHLVIANLAWLLVFFSNAWMHNRILLQICLIGSVFTILYSLVLFNVMPKRVEKSARPRLRKRIALYAFQSLTIAAISFSFIH